MQENFHFFQIITIIGALGFFIYGMKVMSEGIQKVAGSKLRGFLDKMMSNRFSSIFTGFLTTTLVQSSSATTVMIVSFVNAGLLNLRQAIGVIMGANIGTTMTAWMIAFVGFQFKISEYAYPVLGIGVPLLFFKQEKLKFFGEFLTGFGLLFLGLDALKYAFEVINLKNNADFIQFLSAFSDPSIKTTLLFVLIGSILTIVVQSSSAAMALTLTLIDSGLPLHLAAAIVLGENIGTTVTANLAAMVGNTSAKRAARAHFIFNIFGAIWMLFIFHPFVNFVYQIISKAHLPWIFVDNEKDVIRYSLAFFHTSFNIINTFLLVGFIPLIEKLVIKMVKSPTISSDEEDFKLEYFSAGLVHITEISLLEAEKALEKFGLITQKMLENVEKLLQAEDHQTIEKITQRIKKQEILTDQFEEEMIHYLTRVSTTGLSDTGSVELRSLLSITYDLERIGDLCRNIADEYKEKPEHWLDETQKNELLKIVDQLHIGFALMLKNLQQRVKNIDFQEINSITETIENQRKIQRQDYLERLKKGQNIQINSEISYNNIFYFFTRIAHHIANVSEALSGKN